jgi:hypothetical protein
MMDDAVQGRAPGASTTPPPRPTRSPATPPPSGGSVHQATQTVTLDSARPVPPGPAPAAPPGEPRYTLAEARRRLGEIECAEQGHELREIRRADGTTVSVYCERCAATFEPPLLPPLPPENELRVDVFRAGLDDVGSVRLVHIKTGTVATGDGGKSQTENHGRAERILRARLYIRSLGGGGPQPPAEPVLPELTSDGVRYDLIGDGSGQTGGYAVRATHVPTGMKAEASAGRSNQQKRDAAAMLLRARLLVARLEGEAK